MPILKLDKIDYAILKMLQKYGRITNAQLSSDIGLSQAPTLERVKKLEQAGFITGYYGLLDRKKLGLDLITYVMISLKQHNKEIIDKFIHPIKKIDEVIECHHITGTSDFILKVVSENIYTYQKLIVDKISSIEEVKNIESMVVLSTFKETTAIPLK